MAYAEGVTLQHHVAVVNETDFGTLQEGDVPIVKLHGCVNHADSLVLGLRDLYKRKREASLLFTFIEQMHLQGPVIYAGYSLSDQHIVEWIFEMTQRLGQFRQPIVFVGSPHRDEWQQRWVERVLDAEYLPMGFSAFMDELCNRTNPPIGASMVVARPFAPCWVDDIAGHGCAELQVDDNDGEWECFLNYRIDHEEGFACLVFERFDGPMDVSSFSSMVFELFLPEYPRADPRIEALKLESPTSLYPHLLDTTGLPKNEWTEIRLGLDKFPDVDLSRLLRITLADNGHRAKLGQDYRIGIRRVRFV